MDLKDKENKTKIETLADWIQKSNYTVIFTGAGMSTESGIPDFRSKDGLWKGIDPMTVATADVLEKDYDQFYAFYKTRVKSLKGTSPHKGYDILAKWEQEGLIQRVITQNIDGFHKRAGNKNVIPLHGSIHDFRCNDCNKATEEKAFMEKKSCRECGGSLRPDVVLFGERLNQDYLEQAEEEMKKAELVIIIGTSLMIYPVNQLPAMTRGKTVYINKEVPEKSFFDLVFEEKAGKVLQNVDTLIEL